MYNVLSNDESSKIIGGNPYIYKCWDTKGKEYWDTQPSRAGCENTKTGAWETGKKKQRSGGK